MRHLGFGTSVALILGSMVGAGIFLTPSLVAQSTRSVWVYLAFWLAGGATAFIGALAYAELGSRFPRAGGDYVFLSKAFGQPVANAWGWMSFLASFSGSIAALSIGAADTLAATRFGASLASPLFEVLGRTFAGRDLLAVSLVMVVTLTNVLGATLASWAQVALTWLPIAGFLAVSVAALATGADVGPAASAVAASAPPGGLPSATAAYSAVFFAFSGWNVLTYLGGEVKSPKRLIPASILTAVGISTALYLILNVAFLALVPIENLPGVVNTGTTVFQRLFGDSGADAFATLYAISILACLNVTTMAGSRIWLAMTRDGHMWRRMAEIHPRTRTPVIALAVQGTWTILLVLTGSFASLVTLTGEVMILLSCVTVGTLFVFRRRGRDATSWQAPGFPWLPSLYILFSLGVLGVGVATTDSPHAIFGIAFFVALVLWCRFGPDRAFRRRGATTPVDRRMEFEKK